MFEFQCLNFLNEPKNALSTSRNTKEKRHVMTFKDKAKWFSFEMSFVLAQSYAYACAYIDAYVLYFPASSVLNNVVIVQ